MSGNLPIYRGHTTGEKNENTSRNHTPCKNKQPGYNGVSEVPGWYDDLCKPDV